MVIIDLPINLNKCFGCLKESFHRDGSFEYPQHMFWLRNKENSFQFWALSWRPSNKGCDGIRQYPDFYDLISPYKPVMYLLMSTIMKVFMKK